MRAAAAAACGGPARVEVRTTLRNFTNKRRDVSLVLDVAGERIRLSPRPSPPRRARELSDDASTSSARACGSRAARLYNSTVSGA